jgi:3-dehydroquinate synthase
VWIENNIEKLVDRSSKELAEAIKKSCEIKAKVVALDEKEVGKRALLNFGHTFAHAIENGLGYGEWLHGEAVGCGMVIASKLSVDLGLIKKSDEERITNLINRAGLPIVWPDWTKEKYFKLMSNDKKIKKNVIHYVVLDSIGRAKLLPVKEGVIAGVLFGVKS